MNIGIRRNRDLTFEITNRISSEDIRKLSGFGELTDGQKKALEEGRKTNERFEAELWRYLEEHPTFDCAGALIKRSTHEIGYDLEEVYDEKLKCTFGVPKNVWVRPIESEYNK